MDYANQQKALLNQVIDNACINRRDLLSNLDKDFIRDRKLPLKTMLQIIISMQGGSINRELYDYDKTIDYITQKGSSKTVELADVVGLSQPRVRVLLAELTADGIIEPKGEGRARVYILKQSPLR